MSKDPWYVIQTKPRHEEIVAQQLRRIEILIYSPRIWGFVKTRGGRQTQSIRPLFPGYIFTAADLEDPAIFRVIRYTRGVNKILAQGNKAIPLQAGVIEMVRSREGEDGIIKPAFNLKKGDEIRVRHGFLQDLVGILDRPTSDGERVVVLLKLLQKQVRVTLPISQIEKMS